MQRKILTIALVPFMMGIAGCSRTVEDVSKWEAKGNVEKLKGALTDPKEEVRQAAAESLGTLKAESAVDALAARFNDDEDSVVLASVNALSAIGGETITTPMIAALKLDNPAARISAAKGLGTIKAKSAVAPLAEAMNDNDEAVQCAVATAIGQIGDSTGSTPLAEKLVAEASSITLKLACLEALARIGGPEALDTLVNALADDNKTISDAAMAALVRVGNPAIPSIMQALRNDDARVRRGAMALLRGLSAIPTKGDDLVWFHLARASSDDKKGIDRNTVALLAKLGEPAIPALLQAASHRVPIVRDYASLALEEIGESCISQAQQLVAANATPEAKAWFARRGDWIGAPARSLDLWGAVAALNPDFDDEASETTRAQVPMLIIELGDESACAAAKEKLAAADYRATLPLIAAIESDNESIAENAADLVGDQADKRAFEPLTKALGQRIEAGETLSNSPFYTALVKLDMPDAETLIMKVRPNSDRAIRVFEKQYRDARVIGAATTDPYTNNEAPISFRLAYTENGKSGSFEMVFKKDLKGDWRPSPALPYKLPILD